MDGAANQIVGMLSPRLARSARRSFARAEYLLTDYGVFSTTPRKDQPSNRFLSDEIRGLGVFANIMPVIFLAVAAMVLNMLMVRLIGPAAQRRRHAQSARLFQRPNVLAFFEIRRAGRPVRWAARLADGLRHGDVRYVDLSNVLRISRSGKHHLSEFVSQGLAISLICSLIGSLARNSRHLRLSPAEAMRPQPPVAGGRIWLEHFAGFWQRLSFGWRLVLRNVVRHKARTAVGVFAACMGAAILTSGFMLRFGIEYIIEFQFDKVMHSDVDLSFKDERGWDALQECRNLPGVDYAEPTLDVACDFYHGPIITKEHHRLATDARLLVPHDQDGDTVPIQPVGLTMTRKMADLLHLQRGDRC